MKWILVCGFIFSIACGSNTRYEGELDIKIIGPHEFDSGRVEEQTREALGDILHFTGFDMTAIENSNIIFDFHDNEPWLCKEIKSGSCTIESHPAYYAEINFHKGHKKAYSFVYHEAAHYALWLSGMEVKHHHLWLKRHSLCKDRSVAVGTHCLWKDIIL
jgi:hypothetical protein